MKNNFEEIYEGGDYKESFEALLGKLNKRSEEVYTYSRYYTYNEYKVLTDLFNYYHRLIRDYKHSLLEVNFTSKVFEKDIQQWFDYLDEKEKEERRHRIRNGVTFGIGALLAPTGIPAAIIVSKKLKEAFSEGYGD